MIEVEIKGHYGQLIKGYLRRIIEDKGVIVYADDPASEETIPLSELRLPPTYASESMTLAPQLRVEALLPVAVKENSPDNSFTEALANLKISQSVPQTASASRLANPFSCLTCPSWWPCVVRGAHVVVQLRPVLPATDESAPPPPKEYTELAATLAAMTEICERQMLRPASAPDAPSLNSDSLFTHIINIPPEILPYASDTAVHECMLRHCGGPASITFEKDHLVILSPSQEVIRVAGLLEEIHIRMLRQKWGILRYINQTKKFHDTSAKDGSSAGSGKDGLGGKPWSSVPDNYFVEVFDVPSSLMGLAIGPRGANINAARAIPGVVRIDVDEAPQLRNGTTAENEEQTGSRSASLVHNEQHVAHFTVVAETDEAAKSARSALEFCRLCILVPKRLIGRIVGNRTANILSINEKSGVKRINLETNTEFLPKHVDSETTEDGRPPTCIRVEDIHPDLASPSEKDVESGFFLVGSRESVDTARLLITFQINCIFDLERLECEKYDLLREFPPQRGGPFPGPQHDSHHQHLENGGPSRGGARGGGNSYPPRGVAAGDPHDDAPRGSGGGYPGRGAGRRGGRPPPRSSGDMSDGHQGGSPREGSMEPVEKVEDAGRRRNGRGNRQRGRGGAVRGRIGTGVDASATVVDECNGGDSSSNAPDYTDSKKEAQNESSGPAHQNGKRHPVNAGPASKSQKQ
ncbi:unnamed protein product [Mesocestoides corti]|uniref:K Homology domain-containing protein n=1 Tax=Mesocestoides corti TaxID=53468 RepID=A0A0R3U2Z7_MESCO|nr:unnamed protein product [Mesocestoides corti]